MLLLQSVKLSLHAYIQRKETILNTAAATPFHCCSRIDITGSSPQANENRSKDKQDDRLAPRYEETDT